LSGLAVIGYVLIVVVTPINLSDLPFLHAVLAVAGAIATIALEMSLSSSPVWSFVRTLGVYSLEIYVAHTIFAAGARIAVQKDLGSSGQLLHLVVGTAVGIMFPMLLAIWGPKVGKEPIPAAHGNFGNQSPRGATNCSMRRSSMISITPDRHWRDGPRHTTPDQNPHLSMPVKERGFAGRGLIPWDIGPCDARVQRGH
jgi:hypothetical protein